MATVPFPSQSASQQFTYESSAGFTYTLHKLPAMRYLSLGNALVAYFGEATIKAIITFVKNAKTHDFGELEKKSDAELMDNIVAALEDFGGLRSIPMDAFQNLARLLAPYISVAGKPAIMPHELNVQLVDAGIDMMFAQNPSDVLPVVGRAIAFNMSDFFSGARLPSILKRRTEST
jgi:hypothetical protein